MVRTAYLKGDPSDIRQTLVYLQGVLAYLRSMYLAYQTAHWQITGDPAYGNHLLFQRLYEGVQGEVDTLAEKMVGMFGSVAVDLAQQAALMDTVQQGFSQVADLHERGIRMEEDLQSILKEVYDAIKALGTMTLGLDDYLMATASAHDTNLFLLQQVVARQGAPKTARRRASSAEGVFFDNPERREVRNFAHSGARSNIPEVAVTSAIEDGKDEFQVKDVAVRAEISPPNPTEIEEQPGAWDFSTLSRYVIQTKQPTDKGLPEDWLDLPKHEVLDPSADDVVTWDGLTIDPSPETLAQLSVRSASMKAWTFARRA